MLTIQVINNTVPRSDVTLLYQELWYVSTTRRKATTKLPALS
jgi:hypothetical protein